MSTINSDKQSVLNQLMSLSETDSTNGGNNNRNQRNFDPPDSLYELGLYLNQGGANLGNPPDFNKLINLLSYAELYKSASPQEQLFLDILKGLGLFGPPGGNSNGAPNNGGLNGFGSDKFDQALALFDQLVSANSQRTTLNPHDDPNNFGFLLNLAAVGNSVSGSEEDGFLFNSDLVPMSDYYTLAQAGDGDVSSISVADLQAIALNETGTYTEADVAFAKRLLDNPDLLRQVAGEHSPDTPLTDIEIEATDITRFLDIVGFNDLVPSGQEKDEQEYFNDLDTFLQAGNNGDFNPTSDNNTLLLWNLSETGPNRSVTLDNGWTVDFNFVEGEDDNPGYYNVVVTDTEGNKVYVGDQVNLSEEFGEGFDVTSDDSFTLNIGDDIKITFQNNAEGRVDSVGITNSRTGESLHVTDLNSGPLQANNVAHAKNADSVDHFFDDGVSFKADGQADEWLFAQDNGDFSEDAVTSESALESGVWELEWDESVVLPSKEFLSQEAYENFLLTFLENNFEQLDLNGDGTLTFKELNTVLNNSSTPQNIKDNLTAILYNTGSQDGSDSLLERLYYADQETNTSPLTSTAQIEFTIDAVKSLRDPNFATGTWAEQDRELLTGPSVTKDAENASATYIIYQNFDVLAGEDGKLTKAELEAWASDPSIPAHVREAINVFLNNGLFEDYEIFGGAGNENYILAEPEDGGAGTGKELRHSVTDSSFLKLLVFSNESIHEVDDPLLQLELALQILGTASWALEIGSKDEWSVADLRAIAEDESLPQNLREAAALVADYLENVGTADESNEFSKKLRGIDEGGQDSGYENRNNALNVHQLRLNVNVINDELNLTADKQPYGHNNHWHGDQPEVTPTPAPTTTPEPTPSPTPEPSSRRHHSGGVPGY